MSAAPGERPRIDELLEDSRRHLRRVRPDEAMAIRDDGGLLVDTRPSEQRRTDGAIPGAVVIDRNVLEWRLDPSSPDRHPAVREGDYERAVVLVCNEGFASSLAADTLQRLGLRRATDLDGGFQAWRAAGLPVEGVGGEDPAGGDAAPGAV
jgi:rhodanese-related sulfurtransferase